MLFRVDGIDESIRVANDTPFGLGASAWTNDPAQQERFIAELDAGMVFINGMVASDARMPFGGLEATPPSDLARIFMSPGPIYDPEGRRPDYWRAARVLHAAGFRRGDVVLNCFSYHFTPAGSGWPGTLMG